MADVASTTKKFTYGTWKYQRTWSPKEIVDAEGCYFSDASGKRYLDFSSQLMCSNLGHKNKAVIEAICEQARRLPYIYPGFACGPRSQLSTELTKVLPHGLEKFFYATSGTEANEAAIKTARLFTGKYKIISRYQSYHGSTTGSISVSGDPRRIPLFADPFPTAQCRLIRRRVTERAIQRLQHLTDQRRLAHLPRPGDDLDKPPLLPQTFLQRPGVGPDESLAGFRITQHPE